MRFKIKYHPSILEKYGIVNIDDPERLQFYVLAYPVGLIKLVMIHC